MDGQAQFDSNEMSVKVKNTFIDMVGSDDLPSTGGLQMRQASEPAPSMYSAAKSSSMPPYATQPGPAADTVPMALGFSGGGSHMGHMGGGSQMGHMGGGVGEGYGAGGIPGAGLFQKDPRGLDFMGDMMGGMAAGAAAAARGPGPEMQMQMLPEMLGGAAAPPPEWQKKTTIMMRNLPNKYTQRMLLTEINHTGFLGTFDFLYLPIDVETNANKGYAFLNFVDPGFAWMFRMSYEGRKMSHFNSNKVVSVTPAALQGFEANYAHYANARVNRGDPSCRPLFLREPKLAVPGQGNSGQSLKGGRRGGRRGGGGLDQLVEAQERQEELNSAIQTAVQHAAHQIVQPMAEAQPQQVPGPPAGAGSLVPRFCHNCGGKVQPTFKFCANCGASLDLS